PLLRQMVCGVETDPKIRRAAHRHNSQELDEEIARVESGDINVLGASAQRDRFQQFPATVRELLSDFREVEENFRTLDRQLRERIAACSGSKGELLDDILGNREAIADSD